MMSWRANDFVTKFAGAEAAKELSTFQTELLYAMKEVVDKEQLDCDFVMTRSLEIILDQSHADALKKIYEDQIHLGLDYIRDVDFIGPRYAERVQFTAAVYPV